MTEIAFNRVKRKLPNLSTDELLALELEIQVEKQRRGLNPQSADSGGIDPDDFEVYQSGTGAIAKTLKEQRDRYKREVEGAHRAIQQTIQLAEVAVNQSGNELLRQKERYQQDAQSKPIPLTIERIDRLATKIEHVRVGIHKQVSLQIFEQGSTTYEDALGYALSLAVISGGREVQINLLRHLRSIFDSPYTICFELLWECRSFGKPYVETVSRLDIAWIKENINSRIGKHSTLWEGIHHAYQYRKSGVSLESYGHEHNISSDNLRWYVKYFSRIEELAKAAPDDLRAEYPDVLK